MSSSFVAMGKIMFSISSPLRVFLDLVKCKTGQYASSTNAVGCNIINKLIRNFGNPSYFIYHMKKQEISY